MSIEWTEDLNTGIDVIDGQHQRIVDYINQLEAAIEQPAKLAVGEVLADLAIYCLSHLAFEESLMEQAEYAQSKAHKATHDQFVKRLERYQQRHDAGEDVARQLHAMLASWLVHHIKRADMAYVAEVQDSLRRIVRDQSEGSWLSRALRGFFGRPRGGELPTSAAARMNTASR